MRVQLRADEENAASKKVAENAGFTREGVLRSSRYNARLNRRVDFVMYSLLPGELPQS
jgi:RimJ/RimL family protein N-acetyltransferase